MYYQPFPHTEYGLGQISRVVFPREIFVIAVARFTGWIPNLMPNEHIFIATVTHLRSLPHLLWQCDDDDDDDDDNDDQGCTAVMPSMFSDITSVAICTDVVSTWFMENALLLNPGKTSRQ